MTRSRTSSRQARGRPQRQNRAPSPAALAGPRARQSAAMALRPPRVRRERAAHSGGGERRGRLIWRTSDCGPRSRAVRWRVGRGDRPLARRGVHVRPGGEAGERQVFGSSGWPRTALEGVGGRLRSLSARPRPILRRCAIWLLMGGLVRRQEAVQRQNGVRGRSLLGRGLSGRCAGLGVRPCMCMLRPLAGAVTCSPRRADGTGAEKLPGVRVRL